MPNTMPTVNPKTDKNLKIY